MLRFETRIRSRVLEQFLNCLFRDLACCATNKAGHPHRPETQHCSLFRAFQAESGVKPAFTCTWPGCRPEHATVRWTVALPSKRSGRREASRSDERREPPESKVPVRRQPGRLRLASAEAPLSPLRGASLRPLRVLGASTVRWAVECSACSGWQLVGLRNVDVGLTAEALPFRIKPSGGGLRRTLARRSGTTAIAFLWVRPRSAARVPRSSNLPRLGLGRGRALPSNLFVRLCGLRFRGFSLSGKLNGASFESVVAGRLPQVHGRCGRKDPRKSHRLDRWAIMAHPRGKSHRPAINAAYGRDGREGTRCKLGPRCASVGAKTRSVERGALREKRMEEHRI